MKTIAALLLLSAYCFVLSFSAFAQTATRSVVLTWGSAKDPLITHTGVWQAAALTDGSCPATAAPATAYSRITTVPVATKTLTTPVAVGKRCFAVNSITDNGVPATVKNGVLSAPFFLDVNSDAGTNDPPTGLTGLLALLAQLSGKTFTVAVAEVVK